ncbi:hypothetical protein [Photobacterium damselae]|uniref:hypothetical protein n=1 Tax=Photobacterium damselae TaxID=38293 RepID=UPI0035A9029F
MNKKWLAIALLMSTSASANIHFSPDIKLGPYYLGLGAQVGLQDVMSVESVYGSFGYMDSTFLSDKETMSHYRIGTQYKEQSKGIYSVQLEAGVAKYKGARYYWRDKETKESYGPSIAGALVFNNSSPFQVRVGAELSYFKKSYLPSRLAPNVTFGILMPL